MKEEKKKERSFSFLQTDREGEKRKRENQNFSLRSTELCRSEFIGPRTKVHLLDEGYVGTENIGFCQGFKRGVREIKCFGFRKCQRDFLDFLLRSKR